MKPMLAAAAPALEALKFPVWTSMKLDGIRAVVKSHVLLSRNLKPIPSIALRGQFSRPEFEGLDGELICGDPRHPEVFTRTTSAAMSHDAPTGDVRYHVFDAWTESAAAFERRAEWLTRRVSTLLLQDKSCGLVRVIPTLCRNADDVRAQQELALNAGYEGLMINGARNTYKFGRSTVTEGALLKLKVFEDAEAVVIGAEEQMKNNNAATTDALGRTKRTTHQANKTGKGTLGALVVRGLNGPYKDAEFSVGSGMDDALRAELWANSPIGRVVKYKYFPSGTKDAPRFPVFLGFRAKNDMS